MSIDPSQLAGLTRPQVSDKLAAIPHASSSKRLAQFVSDESQKLLEETVLHNEPRSMWQRLPRKLPELQPDQPLRGVIMAHCGGLRIELLEGDFWLQELLCQAQ